MEPLFKEWMDAMEVKILAAVRDRKAAAPSEIAVLLGMSEVAVVSLICGMAEKGVIRVTGIEAAEPPVPGDHNEYNQ